MNIEDQPLAEAAHDWSTYAGACRHELRKLRADLAARDALVGELLAAMRDAAELEHETACDGPSGPGHSSYCDALRALLARTPADAAADLAALRGTHRLVEELRLRTPADFADDAPNEGSRVPVPVLTLRALFAAAASPLRPR